MNNIDKQYTKLLQDIIHNGVEKKDRTGTGTISVFGRQIRHKMSEGFPLLTTKKMAWKSIVTELLWFLRGDTNIKYLVDNGCHIWDGDAYKNYEKKAVVGDVVDSHYVPATDKWNLYNKEEFISKIKTDDKFAKKWGELGPIYGKQWRKWKSYNHAEAYFGIGIDQIANLISELKTNPDSRRLLVSAWNVADVESGSMVLPPCHYGFQVYTRELSEDERYDLCAAQKSKMTAISEEDYIKYNIPTRAISLMWNQRSIDTGLGLPFNIASYGLLLEIIAKEVNMVPDELIGNLGDVHLYTNHIEQAKEQIGRDLSLEERKQIFEDRGYVCDVWPFNGDWNGEYDGFGIPKRTREPYPLPKLKILDSKVDDIAHYEIGDFIIEGYQSHPAIKMPLSN